MTKKNMIEKIVSVTGLSKKDAEAAVNAYEEALVEAVKSDETYKINGLGTVRQAVRAARRGRNPMTGEDIQIPETKVVKIKTSKTFAE